MSNPVVGAPRCTKLIRNQWSNYVPSDRITTYDQLLFLTNSILNRVAVINGNAHDPGHGDVKAICRKRAHPSINLSLPEFCVWLYEHWGDEKLTHCCQPLPKYCAICNTAYTVASDGPALHRGATIG